MYDYKVKAYFPEHLRGVTTEVRQTLNVGDLSEKDLKRVLNAVKRGRVPTSGFVHGIATICAEHLGTMTPVSMIKRSWGHTVDVSGLPNCAEEKDFAEVMKLSDVRMQIFLAENPNTAKHRYWGHPPKAQFMDYSNYGYRYPKRLSLPGWEGPKMVAECQKQVLDALNKAHPQFKTDMQKLHDFIATKPKFVRETRESR